MHRESPSPHVDIRVEDGHLLPLGELRLNMIHTPGHTRDSMCVHVEDRVFSGDTLLIGGTGRTDLPTGDAEQLYDSLFDKLRSEEHPSELRSLMRISYAVLCLKNKK